MRRLIKADFIQLVTTRTALWWAIVCALLMLLSAVIVLSAVSMGAHVDGRELLGHDLQLSELISRSEFNPLVYLFVLITVSANYRHRVAVTEHLLCANFWKTSLSKMIVFALCGAIVAVLQKVIFSLPFFVWPGIQVHVDFAALKGMGTFALLSALVAICSVALARLLRHQVVVLLVGIVYAIFIDPILRGPVLPELLGVSEKLRSVLVQYVPGEAFMNVSAGLPLEALSAGCILLVWAVTLTGLTSVLDMKRDWR